MTESQSADAEPPPPPKPDLSRYTGLRTHLTLATNEGKEGMQVPGSHWEGSPGLCQADRSQGRRPNRLQGRPEVHQHHLTGQNVPTSPGWYVWPLALGEACGVLTAGSAPSERSRGAEPRQCAACLDLLCAAVLQAGAGASPG